MNTDFHFGAKLFFLPVSYCQFERDTKYLEIKKQYKKKNGHSFSSHEENF